MRSKILTLKNKGHPNVELLQITRKIKPTLLNDTLTSLKSCRYDDEDFNVRT